MLVHIVGTVYLDHAGATLYSELQMEAIFRDFTTNVYGNPRILFYESSCFHCQVDNFLSKLRIFLYPHIRCSISFSFT